MAHLLSDEEILELIQMPKRAYKAERRNFKVDHRHKKNSIYLRPEAGDDKQFTIFMRQAVDFSENFSVGLRYTNFVVEERLQRELLLIRFQGPHDSGKPLGSDMHHSYHMHILTSDDIASDRYDDPSNSRETQEYASFEQAFLYFVEFCGILGWKDCIRDFTEAALPRLNPGQTTLFGG